MQLQSATDPPKKLELGERAVTGDGNDYLLTLLKEKRLPVEIVYPAEGAPLIVVPSAVFANAPNPNAARLFQSFLLGLEGQTVFSDTYALRSAHTLVKERPGRTPFAAIKLMKADPAALEAQAETSPLPPRLRGQHPWPAGERPHASSEMRAAISPGAPLRKFLSITVAISEGF
jgi:iron(III) transport system substrate-binding protein